MSNTNYVAFFGDRKRDFRLTPSLITELERLTGMGIGAFCQRLFAMDFRHADMLATIRLALIGGGTSHEEADRLVRAYGADHSIMHVYPLAVDILDHLWSGPRQEDAGANEAPEASEPSPPQPEPEATASPARPFDHFNPSADDELVRRLRNGMVR